MAETTHSDRAGWSISSYCALCNFSRALFYKLPVDRRPRTLRIGKRHIVIEPPGAYLLRLAELQEEAQ